MQFSFVGLTKDRSPKNGFVFLCWKCWYYKERKKKKKGKETNKQMPINWFTKACHYQRTKESPFAICKRMLLLVNKAKLLLSCPFFKCACIVFPFLIFSFCVNVYLFVLFYHYTSNSISL